MPDPSDRAIVEVQAEAGMLLVSLGGKWSTRATVPSAVPLAGQIRSAEDIAGLKFVQESGLQYDSSLASYVFRAIKVAQSHGLDIDTGELPGDLMSLVSIGQKVPEQDTREGESAKNVPWIREFGQLSQDYLKGSLEIATFTGEWVMAIGRLLRGKARLRSKDFWEITKAVSADALPIVALISFLVGVIISFLGAVTLKRFGAEFAVAYLVGFGILREMGAIMTGIIMAGRTGAAFAAQIGSMKINEEIDALRTLGISPIDFIVLPRLLALFVMMPLLTIYSNVIGILSGWLVAEGLMGVPTNVYFSEMQLVVDTGDFMLGMFKACVFGVLVATAGCLRGLQSGSGADAVGVAATRAVVAGITLIIFSNAVIDWAAATIGI